MRNKKTKFDKKVIISLINTSIKKVPGIKSVTIDEELSNFLNNNFVIKIVPSEDTLNIFSVAYEAQNLVHYELNEQLNDDVVVNIIINCQ